MNVRRFAKSLSLILLATVFTVAQQQPPLTEKCACPSPSGDTAPNPNPPPMGPYGHPHPQIRPEMSTVTTVGDTTYVSTGKGLFAASDPFKHPPGTNFLPTVYSNMFDSLGNEMPNTLPSTPTVPYNLHDGDPVVTNIDPRSPTDDMLDVLEFGKSLPPIRNTAAGDEQIRRTIQRGLDILEGNPLPDRVYSGLPLLHYKAVEKCKKVIAIRDATGKVIGGNVNIHQVWYDIHIESDTAFLDTTEVRDVPWTITYTVDVLNRAHDDFSPFVMYFDNPAASPPGKPPMPHVGMDQSFFNMEDGTRTVFKIKMAPGKYYNLTYTWGWRNHPPRVQVTENSCKRMKNAKGVSRTLVEWEADVFGENPSASEADKLKAIAKIGDLAPEKIMWRALRVARDASQVRDYETVKGKFVEARKAYGDWRNRNQLPSGVSVDPNADMTLLYVNNTIYAEIIGGGFVDFPKWSLRGTTLKITIKNGDYFEHGYQNVDFGGARGWENQFKSSSGEPLLGSGCLFTFGRAHWWMNIPNMAAMPPGWTVVPEMVVIPPATPYNNPGMHKVEITYNYEPSRRLRFYQFDPVHHDVAIFSVH
ncbi:MAG TPA: hypothetical protein VK582_11555 [Pyrinomonadaceae bacterium]|nr:hypothetical protein [Pyrinomonadaceae bacterium]